MACRGARRGAPVVGAAVAGLLLAACSSGSPAAGRPGTVGHGRGATPAATSGRGAATSATTGPNGPGAATTTAPAPGPGSTTSSTTPSSASLAACSSGVLGLAEGGAAAAAGTAHVTFVLTDEGPQPCTLQGYPAVGLFGLSGAAGAGAGAPLGLRTVRLGSGPAVVTVSAGRPASFVLSVSDVPVDGAGCQQVASLQVTPPGAGGALSVPASFQACGATVGVYPVTAAG